MEPGWQGLAGFRGPQQNPSELSESAYLQIFATKTSFFIIAGKQAICGWQKDLHTHRHVPSNTLFDVKIYMYFGYVLVVRKLSKSGLSNSSTKAGSLKALWKLSESSPKALWKLYESRLYESSKKALRKLSENSLETLRKLYESYLKAGSLKAGWLLLEALKALRKLSENSLETLRKLYESSLKAGSPKALRKQADFCWKPFKSKLT